MLHFLFPPDLQGKRFLVISQYYLLCVYVGCRLPPFLFGELRAQFSVLGPTLGCSFFFSNIPVGVVFVIYPDFVLFIRMGVIHTFPPTEKTFYLPDCYAHFVSFSGNRKGVGAAFR